MLVFVEDNATQYVQKTLYALCPCLDDPLVSDKVRESLRLIGVFVAPEHWMGCLLPKLGPDNENNVRRHTLAAIKEILPGADPRRLSPQLSHLVSCVCSDELIGTRDTKLQQTLAGLLEWLVGVMGAKDTDDHLVTLR